jgi:hypothetical protein
MNWTSEVCKNCGFSSYYLYNHKICPYCDPKVFVERILREENSFKDIEQLKKYIKKYKITAIDLDEEIKNALLCGAAFGNIEKSKIELLKEIINKMF